MKEYTGQSMVRWEPEGASVLLFGFTTLQDPSDGLQPSCLKL